MRRYWMILVLFTVVAFCTPHTARAWAPADYPGVYRSGASLVANGVIYGGPSISAMGACEFYNSAASAQFYMIYNSATVAAQLPANMICATSCAATSFCQCYATQPMGPRVNGAIQASNGLSWAASSTFPAQTGTAANSWALCTFNVNP